MRALNADQQAQLGRFLPGPRMGERIANLEDAGYLHIQTWNAPDAAAAAVVLASTTQATGATLTVTTGITNPDFPRGLSVTGNQGTVAGNVVVTGTNIEDDAITETIVANGVATVAGLKAFKTVTQIVLPARAAASDAISVGISDVMGADILLPRNTTLLTFFNGALEGTAPTVTLSGTAVESCTFNPNSALDASGDLEIVYLDINGRLSD